MNLVPMKKLLTDASNNSRAVAAVNVSNMESIMALIEVANNKNIDVIIQVAPIQLETQHISYQQIYKLVKLFLKDVSIEVALHLDHATTVTECYDAIDAGFTSVMFDGSLGDYDDNVNNTVKVVNYAKNFNVTVEAELGKVGGNEGKADPNAASFLTKPEDVKAFINATHVDCLAIAIGNAHGLYKSEPNLDFKRLEEIHELVPIPLVLHGGTGISPKDIDAAISRGIRKINFFTEVDREYVKGFVNAYEENNDLYMMAACEHGRQTMMLEIEKKLNMCARI
jgi:ketose-bisphosphate aldolase